MLRISQIRQVVKDSIREDGIVFLRGINGICLTGVELGGMGEYRTCNRDKTLGIVGSSDNYPCTLQQVEVCPCTAADLKDTVSMREMQPLLDIGIQFEPCVQRDAPSMTS